MNHLLILVLALASASLSAQEITPKILKKIGASEYKMDRYNEDGVFIAKNKKTKKWGMFQAWSESDIKEMIPMAYDSIHFFQFNGLVTGVWNQGKVGLFPSPWSFEDAMQTVECLYDGYKIYDVEKYTDSGYPITVVYVAVKKNGLWAWIDWKTGELKTEFEYDLTEAKMPYPHYDQSY